MRATDGKAGTETRFRTGIDELDEILHGGVPFYSVVIIGGKPGTGKTILAQQMMFNNSGGGRKAVYLTTLSESPMKAARFQSTFDFFEVEKFGDTVVYMDIGESIRKEGLAATTDTVADLIRKIQPYVVVVDSFKAIHDLAQSPGEMRNFIYDLAIELAATQVQTFLVGEYDEADIAAMPEFAVADGIIWLTQAFEQLRMQRYLQVLKMRGTSHSNLSHPFTIDRNGINILYFPTETGPLAPLEGPPVATGVAELDFLLRGGVPVGGTMLISGQSGTGKSTLALQFVNEGLERGEPSLYMSYEETPEQLIGRAAGFGWNLRPHVDAGRLQIDYTPLPRIMVPEQLKRIGHLIRSGDVKRAVVDSETMLMHQIDNPDVVREHVWALVSIFAATGCTGYVITDPPIGSDRISRFGVEESIVDGVIVLKVVKEKMARQRFVEVLKLRSADHATGDHLMKITGEGIKVFPRAEEVIR